MISFFNLLVPGNKIVTGKFEYRQQLLAKGVMPADCVSGSKPLYFVIVIKFCALTYNLKF